MLEARVMPYERSFTLVEVKKENQKRMVSSKIFTIWFLETVKKEKVKEPWRKQPKPKPKKDTKKRKEKLKKKGVGTFELDKPLEKDQMDMQWNFGVFIKYL